MQEFIFASEVTSANEMATFANRLLELEGENWTFKIQFHVRANPPDGADDFGELKDLQNKYPWRGQWFRT